MRIFVEQLIEEDFSHKKEEEACGRILALIPN